VAKSRRLLWRRQKRETNGARGWHKRKANSYLCIGGVRLAGERPSAERFKKQGLPLAPPPLLACRWPGLLGGGGAARCARDSSFWVQMVMWRKSRRPRSVVKKARPMGARRSKAAKANQPLARWLTSEKARPTPCVLPLLNSTPCCGGDLLGVACSRDCCSARKIKTAGINRPWR
jgi:hypothetical protein